MNWRTLAGMTAVTVILLAILGIVTNFFTRNDLLLSSDMQIQALVTLGFVLVVLALIAAIGRPWTEWSRTPYW